MISKEIAKTLEDKLRRDTSSLKELGITPTLAILSLADEESSAGLESYLKSIRRKAKSIGIEVIHNSSSSSRELLETLDKLSSSENVNGILILKPLPDELIREIPHRIPPLKDIECISLENMGLLFSGHPRFTPPTPEGVMKLLRGWDIPLEGKRVVVIGRSLNVGRPLALMLLSENATVTIAHSRTIDLTALSREADILVSAVGKPEFIREEHIKEGAIVIDLGVNSVNGRLVGDVHLESVIEVASLVTPVKGGVGPLTTLSLLENVLKATKIQLQIKS